FAFFICATSLGANQGSDNVESEIVRRAFTGRGYMALSSWNDSVYTFSVMMLNLGNNPNNKLEIVSLINILNSANHMHYFDFRNSMSNLTPKMYLGTVQTVAEFWDFELEDWTTPGLDRKEKSGS
ncbi:MAG TPA: hypothetical protein DCY93_00045, partial [Firmicutes bacterium]|nr:hypothetical protein [Bacillota bacterium]